MLDELVAYKVRPAPDEPPGKFETGTQNHEGIAGVLGTIEYLEWVGKTFGADYEAKYAERYDGLRLRLKQALAAIRAYEFELSRALLGVLEETPGVTIYGIKEARRLEERVPTKIEMLWQEFEPLVDLESGVLVIDDTTLDKPYASQMALMTGHWSGKHGRVVQRINLISMMHQYLAHPTIIL